MGLPVAALLLTRSLARTHPAQSPYRRALSRVAFLSLAGFALIWVPEVAGLLPARGWPDRVLFLTYTAWVIVVAAPLTHRAQRAHKSTSALHRSNGRRIIRPTPSAYDRQR